MRKCTRCKTEMDENYTLKLENSNYHIVTASKNSTTDKSIGTTHVAVCPECGEVSIYVKNFNNKNQSSADSAGLFLLALIAIIGLILYLVLN